MGALLCPAVLIRKHHRGICHADFRHRIVRRPRYCPQGGQRADQGRLSTKTRSRSWRTGVDKVTKRLVEAGYDEDKARRYGEALETAGALIVADVDDDKADAALETMRKFEVLTPEALLERSGTGQQGKQPKRPR